MVERTDPWRWYCRTCGAKGANEDEGERDREARAHAAQCQEWQVREALIIETRASGRLLHVWGYLDGGATLIASYRARERFLGAARGAGADEEQAIAIVDAAVARHADEVITSMRTEEIIAEIAAEAKAAGPEASGSC